MFQESSCLYKFYNFCKNIRPVFFHTLEPPLHIPLYLVNRSRQVFVVLKSLLVHRTHSYEGLSTWLVCVSETAVLSTQQHGRETKRAHNVSACNRVYIVAHTHLAPVARRYQTTDRSSCTHVSWKWVIGFFLIKLTSGVR